MTMKRTSIIIVGLAVAMSGLVACGDDTASNATDGGTTTSATSSTSTTTPAAMTSVVAYFVRDEKVAPVRRSGTAATPARAALEELLTGPVASETSAGLSTAIPTGTKLLGIDIAGGTATVDLSTEFGSGGGSLSMQERVAQVVYTVTQFSTAQHVVFRIDGSPVPALGGEGLVLDTPQARPDWESMTPAILLENPLPGDALTSPFDISGTANTFEATFQVVLTDSSGAKVYEHFVTATSGTGTRGTFTQQISFTGAASGAGTLKVYEASAKDGSEINVVSIPVTL